MDFSKKLNAIELRKDGLSYKEIRKSSVIKIHNKDLMPRITGCQDGLKNIF